MSESKLKNAPLKEVIFELHWDLAVEDSGIPSDPGFALAQGKFAEKLKSEFPIHKKLIPDNIPLTLFKVPIHQYWKSELTWPVVQHGQGMISVNDTDENYEWENFKPLITSVVDKLVASYDGILSFNRLKLQYVDAWDVGSSDGVQFRNQNLQTEVITAYPIRGKLQNFTIYHSFELENSSLLKLSISNGLNNQTNENSVIWKTSVELPNINPSVELESWLEFAHNETSKMFKEMLNKDFYERLDQ